MVINQRDVYLLPFPLDKNTPDHLFLVLSVKECNEVENTFIAVMITTSTIHKDDFSFDIHDAMFEKPLAKPGSHIRMHLITLWLKREVRGIKINTMKPFYFNQLMMSIGDIVFNYDFTSRS